MCFYLILQESVPEAERGVVGGVQKSLQSLMDMLTYVVGLVISNPKVGTSNRGSQMSKGLMLWLIRPLPFLHLPLHTLFPFLFLLYPHSCFGSLHVFSLFKPLMRSNLSQDLFPFSCNYFLSSHQNRQSSYNVGWRY
jgi:hypothetical protein